MRYPIALIAGTVVLAACSEPTTTPTASPDASPVALAEVQIRTIADRP